MFNEFDFSPGKVTFSNYDISDNEVFDENNMNLAEDMLQVEYSNDLVLDVGWYRHYFVVYIIKNCDWGKPLLKLNSKTYSGLERSLKKAVRYIRGNIL